MNRYSFPVQLVVALALLVGLFFIHMPKGTAQDVYHHTDHETVYLLLDELANLQVIDLNSAVMPYTRKFIAEKLQEASGKTEGMSKRMQEEIRYYLRDFNKELMPDKNFDKRLDLWYYKDSLFTVSTNVIGGYRFITNEEDLVRQRWNGGKIFGYIGKNFGFYANLRDNSTDVRLARAEYLTNRQGVVYKGSNDNSEMRGGLTYNWGWGSVALVKDHFEWGNNYNGSNIFSGRTPSFGQIRLNLKPREWVELNYVHGWLISMEVDSLASYINGIQTRQVFHEKYLAANFLTIKPMKRLRISVGNSIIYSDIGVQPVYLIPIMFYKSVDHTLNGRSNFVGQNAQAFMDISSRQIKHLHLYTSFYLDEIAISRMWDQVSHSNFYSWKAGARVSNLDFLRNVSVTAEYTRTNPITYRHFFSTATFASNRFNLGHYLGDNAQEIHVAVDYKPIPRLHVRGAFTQAEVGENYPYLGGGDTGLGLPFIEEVYWSNTSADLLVRYEVVHDGFVFLQHTFSDVEAINDEILNSYTPAVFQGAQNTWTFGFNFNL